MVSLCPYLIPPLVMIESINGLLIGGNDSVLETLYNTDTFDQRYNLCSALARY